MLQTFVRATSWGRGGRWAGALLGALACIGLALPARAAGEPLTGTFTGNAVGRTVAFRQGGKARSEWAGTLKLKLDNGPEPLVYCVQLEVRVRVGNRYRSDGPVLALPNGCQIRYLLDTYPATEAKTADEAAARQLAIWAFSDGLDPSTIEDAGIRERTTALVQEAEGKPCPERRTTPATLAIEPPVASAQAGQVVTYTLRASPADAGQPVQLALSGAAFFANAEGASTGQQGLRITLDAQGSASVHVISAVAGQALLSATLPYRLEAGTVFSQLDDDKPTQRLVLGEGQDLVANASAETRWISQGPPTTPVPPTLTETPAQPNTPTPTRERREATETPTAPPSETPTAPPSETPTAPSETPAAQPSETPPPAEAATPEAGQAAGGAVPSTLPRTSAPAGGRAWPLLALGALLLCAGALTRSRR